MDILRVSAPQTQRPRSRVRMGTPKLRNGAEPVSFVESYDMTVGVHLKPHRPSGHLAAVGLSP